MASAILTPYLKDLITLKWRQEQRIHPVIVAQQYELRQRISRL